MKGSEAWIATNLGVFRSMDNGTSWSSQNDGLGDVEGWALASTSSGIMLGGYNGIDLLMTPDSEWRKINSNLLVFSLGGSTPLVAGTGGGLFQAQTIDNWMKSTISTGDSTFFSIATGGSQTFVGSMGKVFVTSNAGLTWNNITGNLPSEAVLSLLITGDTLFAGTTGGIYSISIAAPSTVMGATMGGFELGSIHPNPLTSSTSLTFYLPESSDLSIEVLDMTGRAVIVEKYAKLSKGEHSVALQTPSLPTGSYLMRVTSGHDSKFAPLRVVR
jgi:hypothetical protein